MNILIQAGQLILSLSILIILHEAGHFIPARLFKIRVEKFYLFFDPWFSLFKLKKGDTEYGIGWLPIGGYVKISGMVDESMDKEQMKLPPQEWEFRAKPAWQRLIVMLGGVTVNLLLGILIYMMIAFTWGVTTLPMANVKYGVMCDSVSLKIGLRNGDKIVALDGKKVDEFNEIQGSILLDNPRTIDVNRNGEMVRIAIPDTIVKALLKKKSKGAFLSPRAVFVAGDFDLASNAKKAGMQKGDVLVSLNGEKHVFFDEYMPVLSKLKNQQVKVGFVRAGQRKELDVKVDSSGRLGIYAISPWLLVDQKVTQYSFFESIPKGAELGVNTLVKYVKQFKLVFTKEGAKQIGGFGTFASLFGTTWEWESFWRLTAFISIILAFMNILPIPALDGGHVMFLLYEMITRRKPNQKAMEYAQVAGMVLLLALLLFANGNDIFRYFRK
jgi:regulator of sigma E protease